MEQQNRYNELSKSEQAKVDKFINSVASGGRDISEIANNGTEKALPRYNHVFYLGFSVDSDECDPEKVCPDALHEAITKRINSGGLLEAEGGDCIDRQEQQNA